MKDCTPTERYNPLRSEINPCSMFIETKEIMYNTLIETISKRATIWKDLQTPSESQNTTNTDLFS